MKFNAKSAKRLAEKSSTTTFMTVEKDQDLFLEETLARIKFCASCRETSACIDKENPIYGETYDKIVKYCLKELRKLGYKIKKAEKDLNEDNPEGYYYTVTWN